MKFFLVFMLWICELAALIIIGTAQVVCVITGIAKISKEKSNAGLIQKDVTETRAEAEKECLQ